MMLLVFLLIRERCMFYDPHTGISDTLGHLIDKYLTGQSLIFKRGASADRHNVTATNLGRIPER